MAGRWESENLAAAIESCTNVEMKMNEKLKANNFLKKKIFGLLVAENDEAF